MLTTLRLGATGTEPLGVVTSSSTSVPAWRRTATQALRFGLVGVGNTAMCYLVIWALRSGFGTSVGIASAVGYGVSVIQSYLLNRLWTFGDSAARDGVPRQALAFIAVNVVCGLAFTAINVLLHRALSLPVSSVLATAIVTPLSFLLNRWFVFRTAAVAP